MMQDEIEAFAANVRRMRLAKKLSQSQVAERSGIHNTEISRIERGLRDPRLMTVVRLARALGIKPGALLEGICEEGS
jgi:transcriptional regulator with XRE-family HTH domain